MTNSVIVPHDSLLQQLFGATLYAEPTGMYRDAKFIYRDYAPNVHVSDLIGDDFITKWVPSVPVIITTQTGTGKNYFIGEQIVANIITQNRKNNGNLNAKILILSNRVALNLQTKMHYADIIDKYSGPDAPKYLSKFREMSDEEKNNCHDFGAVQIFSYQQIFFKIAPQKNIIEYDFDFVIFDECHFFTQDSVFNAHTDEILKRLVPACSNAIRVYLSATFEDVAHLILKNENYETRPLEKDRPFGHRCGDLIEHLPAFLPARLSSYSDYQHSDITYSRRLEPKSTYRPFWGYSAIIYDMERNYDYLDIQLLPTSKEGKSQKKYQALIKKIKESHSSEKWLIFISNKDDGESLARYLNDDEEIPAAFVCTETKNQSRGSYKAYKNIVENSKFDERVLITTSVLDNGINLKDPMVSNIAIFSLERTSFLQMLGRVRREDNVRVTLHLPEYLATNILCQLKESLKELLKRLKFLTMTPFEKSIFLENLLSRSGFGISNFFYPNIRFSEFSLTKLAITINNLKNFARFYDPICTFDFDEETKIYQTFNDARALYEDIEKEHDELARSICKALNPDVKPTFNKIQIPNFWNSDHDFNHVKNELRELLLKIDDENNDDFDFSDFLYLMRWMDVTIRLHTAQAELRELQASNLEDNPRLDELNQNVEFLKEKQLKMFKMFNLLNDRNKKFCPNSPTFERLLWLEKNINLNEIFSDSIEENIKNLTEHFEKYATDKNILKDLNAKSYGVAQHNSIVKKFGIRPPKEDATTETNEDGKMTFWNTLQRICLVCTGKTIKQIKKMNEFLLCRQIPFRFTVTQLRGNEEGKATFWLIEKTT